MSTVHCPRSQRGRRPRSCERAQEGERRQSCSAKVLIFIEIHSHPSTSMASKKDSPADREGWEVEGRVPEGQVRAVLFVFLLLQEVLLEGSRDSSHCISIIPRASDDDDSFLFIYSLLQAGEETFVFEQILPRAGGGNFFSYMGFRERARRFSVDTFSANKR